MVMLPERDVREILRRESGAEGRRPPSSRTKDQKMARALSLGHRLEEIGIDRMI